MTKKLLTGSLIIAPIAIAVDRSGGGDVLVFVLSCVALVPLAWLIGEATEQAAHHTGPGVGGFINATFGNAPELIISLFAISDGLPEVVRGSLTGSVVGNLLLVLGFSLLFGGRGRLDRFSSFLSLALVLGATLLFLIPSSLAWTGDLQRHSLTLVSLAVSIVLLVVYVVVTWYSLHRHRTIGRFDVTPRVSGWSLRLSLGVLTATTVVTAFVVEGLVGSIETFADRAGLSDFFVAAVIVAIVGNAAEHGGAVVVAARGQIKLAAEIALSSSAQVAVFLIPVVQILSWAVTPALPLAFREVEIVALGGSAVFTALILARGESSRLRGALLVVAYVGVAIAFYVSGNR